MTPHITATQEQLERLNHIAGQLPVRTNLMINTYTRSYTLRNNVYEVFSNYSNPFLYTTLRILRAIDPEMDTMLSELFSIKDRGGTERNDPLRTDKRIGLAYFPKGLTFFNPTNKFYSDKDTAIIRRIILNENAKDPECPESDKAITVKIYEAPEYLHIYFNKYSPQTIKRIVILAMELAYNKLIPDAVKEKYTVDDVNCLNVIMHNIYQPTTDSAELILNSIGTLLDRLAKEEEKDLIKNFATKMQTSMNADRKRRLDNDLQSIEASYNNALENLIRYSASLRNAQQALVNYNEVEFSAITVFLEKIKQHPNTKSFKKINSDCLQFIVEEPIIYTNDKVWSKYISNSTSETRQYIYRFARDYHNYYNTTPEILDFCVQRLFKEVLVDQKIKLFTSSAMYLNQNNTSFRLEKNSLPDSGNFFPHPHLGTNSLTCWGNSITEITKAINADDGETAFLQMMYAFQQMTATDNVVVRKLTEYMLNTRYSKCTVYQKGKNAERTTFENIIKEFVEYETNKINAPDDSSSETGLPF